MAPSTPSPHRTRPPLWVSTLAWSVAVVACRTSPEPKTLWPPADFALDVQYSVRAKGQLQTRQRAQIFADGLVVYREADTSLRSSDGVLQLPVYRRMCVYRMDWHSIRALSRDLYRAPVTRLRQPVNPPTTEDFEMITFHVTFLGQDKIIVLKDAVVGLMNRVLRLVNSCLPEGHGFALPHMAGEPDPHRLLDVAPVVDSLDGALDYHKSWLRDNPGCPFILRETFALACTVGDRRLAEDLLRRLVAAQAADISSFRQILAATKGRPRGS